MTIFPPLSKYDLFTHFNISVVANCTIVRVIYNFIATRRKKSRFLQSVTYFKCVCLSLGLFLCFPCNRSSVGTYHQLACAKTCQILTQIKSPTNKISEESRPFSPTFVFWLANVMLFLLFYLEDPLTTTK